MYETLRVNGVDLSTVVDCVTSLDGLYHVGNVRSDNVVFPGVDGEKFVDRPFASNVIELGLVLKGDTVTGFNDSFRALKKLMQPGVELFLERLMSFSTGNETHVASGELVSGLNPTMQLMRFGKTTIGLKLLDGLWYASAPQTFIAAAGDTVDISGEARTHRMTVVVAPGTTLTNATTGHTIQNGVPVGANVVIDVESLTATQGANDVTNAVTWTGRYPMRLVPGPNTFTGTGCTITYTAAYQ